MRRLALILWLLPLPLAAAELDAQQQARYQVLINELRCLVCQNQTIADSNAELAADLRKQVHDRIAAGDSDQDIRRFVTDRYGDFVLYKPPLSARTAALWVGPFVLVLLGIAWVLRLLRRSRSVPAQAPTAPVDAQRLRELLDEKDP
jgi:cytochrome c-type biogenesis protein CcmH